MLRYAITEGRLHPPLDEPALRAAAARCAGVLAQRVDFLLVREKALEAGALVAFCRRVQALAGATRVLVSSRADIARAAGLAGVHLSAAPGELTPAQIRRLMPGAYVSVSCHTLDQVERAQQQGADSVLFAPIFGKSVAGRQVAPPLGLDALAAACRVGIPVFALGGVTAAHAPACMAAGATGIAGIRTFFARSPADEMP